MEFRSAHSALKWAYRVMDSDLCKTSSVYSMTGTDAARELTAHEQHAQAAIIASIAARSVGEGSAGHGYLLMQYERSAAGIDAVVRHVAAGLGTGLHSRRAIEKCVRSYCGQTIGIEAVRADLKMRKADALEYRRDVYRRLDVLHNIAINTAESALLVAGLIAEAA